MSAFGGEADIDGCLALCPFLTQSGHWGVGERHIASSGFSPLGFGRIPDGAMYGERQTDSIASR